MRNSAVRRNNYLEMLRKKLVKVTKDDKLESLLGESVSGVRTEAELENVSGSVRTGETLDSLVARFPGDSADVKASALHKLKNGDFDDVSPREQLELEAIVEEEGRQVAFVRNDRFDDLPDPWLHFNEPTVRDGIEKAIPWIGRVEVRPSFRGGVSTHLGTGFIVGPNLMMTNRHVAELFVRGLGTARSRLSFVPSISTAINFNREKDFVPSDQSSSLAITDVVMVHPYWDMALFRVDGLPSGTKGLLLSAQSVEDLRDREIAAIGYPGRSRDRSRKAVELEKKYFGDIFGVKRIAPGEIRDRAQIDSFKHLVFAMTHDSSTLPGNSGAAILDVTTGEIVGLHFAGITLKANYAVPMFELARDRRVVDAGLNFHGSVSATDEWENYWKLADLDNESTTRTSAAANWPVQAPAAQRAENQVANWTIAVSVSLDGAQRSDVGPPQTATARALTAPTATGMVEASFQVPIIHPALESRSGYDRHFLEDSGGEEVPMPILTEAGEAAVARLADETFELKYHRFSVVMHKKRRLALFAAANVNWQRDDRLVDGHKPTRSELTGIPDGVLEEWVTDERIPEEDQLPDLFFTKDQGAFDKGHLVRRDDVAWGATFDDIQKGNGDTYHTTNCSPQVGVFNQAPKGDDNWGDLENMIQKQTKAEKVVIFAGPVLSPSDRIFKGIDESGLVKVQIPSRFWKIVVANTEDGVRAFGFVLRQKLTDVPLEFTVPEDWEPFQTPIEEIEESLFDLVDLGWLKKRDTLLM
jgi:endonuclease G, mitochondrial